MGKRHTHKERHGSSFLKSISLASSCTAERHLAAYTRLGRRLNLFQLRCLRHILGAKWQDCTTNSEVLQQADTVTLTTYALLSTASARLRWLRSVCCMEDVRISKSIACSELEIKSRSTGRPILSFKHVSRRDMKTCNIDTTLWERATTERSTMCDG